MKLFYAMGGGMGHLYRTWIFVQQFGLSNFRVITSNSLATSLFSEEQLILLDPDDYSKSWKGFVDEQLPEIQPEAFYIDAFPLGIFGELSVLQTFNFPVHYVARRLKWTTYQKLIGDTKINFTSTLVLEPLEALHHDFVQRHSLKIEELQLHYPAPKISKSFPEHIPSGKKIWLVVHAFNKGEVEVLLQYAQEAARLEAAQPYFLVLSDQQVDVVNGMCIHHPSVVDWFPFVDRIFTGAGFNTVQQVLPFMEKTTMIPFPRKFDDQVWRASHYCTSDTGKKQCLANA